MKSSRLITLLFAAATLTSCGGNNTSYLTRNDWDDRVKENLNSLIKDYGKSSSNYDGTAYAVFDFDNTSAIFDVEEQLLVYQLDTMSLNISPSEMYMVLTSELKHLDAKISSDGSATVGDLIDDINNAYQVLCESYTITAGGLSESDYKTIQNNLYYQEFRAKTRYLYDVLGETESIDASYVWVCNLLTYHLTDDEVYSLATRSHVYYKDVDTEEPTWTSPSELTSKAGQASVSFMYGVSMTENIKELYKALHDNGIDVWICSASEMNVVKAAVDIYGVHDYVKGVTAMTVKRDESGKHICGYDYETGYGQLAGSNGSWTPTTYATKAQTAAEGKVTSIKNAIAPLYKGNGPIAGFMDSSGDFNFCTEFSSLKLVTCFNRANRSIEEGAGLIAIMATIQKDNKLTLKQANKAGDTLYVLQGRDENGKRTFRNSDKTLRFGETEEKLFKNQDNYTLYNYAKEHKYSVKDFLDTFVIKTNAENSLVGLAHGYLETYSGYHSVK